MPFFCFCSVEAKNKRAFFFLPRKEKVSLGSHLCLRLTSCSCDQTSDGNWNEVIPAGHFEAAGLVCCTNVFSDFTCCICDRGGVMKAHRGADVDLVPVVWFHPASRCCHSSHLISWIINEQPVTHRLNLCTTWCYGISRFGRNKHFIHHRQNSFPLPLHKKAVFAVVLTDVRLVFFFFVFFFPFPAAASWLEIDFSRMAYSLLYMLQENVLTTWLILFYELLVGKIDTEALRGKSNIFP